MKFSRLLEYHMIPEWSSYYLDYRYLKKLVKTFKIPHSSASSEISESLLGHFDSYKELTSELSTQSHRVNEFYKEKLSEFRKEIDSMIAYIHNLRRVSSLDEVEARSLLNMKELDDAQNRATSMQRAFTELYQRILWLESYCEFNYIGMMKIIVKGECEEFKDGVEEMEFRNWHQDLEKVKEDVCGIIADEFLNGDLELAKKMLKEAKRFKVSDIGWIGVCIGSWFVILPILGYLFCANSFEEVFMSLYFFRLVFMMGLTIVSFAGVIEQLEVRNINWLYIFQISPSDKISYLSCLTSGIVILTVLSFLLAFHLATEFYYPFLFSNVTVFIAAGIFLLLLLNPLQQCQKNARMEVCKLFLNLIIAPFGQIRFKNYMFGSWTTSMVTCFRDLYLVIYFVASGNFLGNTSGQESKFGLFFVSILPFLWRILQNVKRVLWGKTTFRRQSWNFFRYTISVGLAAMAYLDFYGGPLWIGCFVVGISLTSMIDVVQDWKIELWPWKNGTLFSNRFLEFSIVCNFVLRFAGFLTLMPIEVLENKVVGGEALLTVFAVLELFRRAVWSVIRIEREKRNNDENFRDIQYIPVTFNKN